jgi:hypothetical protein
VLAPPALDLILAPIKIIEQLQHDTRLRRDDEIQDTARGEEVRVPVTLLRRAQNVAVTVHADAAE